MIDRNMTDALDLAATRRMTKDGVENAVDEHNLELESWER
jgi:hypothetical protein